MKKSMWLIMLMMSVFSIQAQVTEGFEGATFPPTDWTQLGGSQWMKTTSSTYVNSGSAAAKCTMLYQTPGTMSLITPKVTPDAINNVFSFYIRKFDTYVSAENVYVKISTTDNMAGSFTTTLLTLTSTQLYNSYHQETVDLSAYIGQNIYIAIVYDATGDNNIYIDDVTMPNLYVGSCAKPTSVAATTINATSATIGWVGDAAANYNIGYRVSGTTTWTATTSTANTVTLTSLSPSIVYEFKVQKNCGAEQSDWSSILTFNTPCNAITTFPFVENFNGTALPSCWFETKAQVTTYGWSSTTTGHDGNGFRFESYNNATGNSSLLKTPVFNISSLVSSELGFWWKNPTGGNFKVVLSTDGGSTFPNVLSDNMTAQTAWAYKTIDISSFIATGSNVVIGFQGTSNWGSGDAYIYIDSVNVVQGASCVTPSNVSVSNVTTNSATATWTSSAANFTTRHRVVGTTPWITNTVSATNSSITGLTPATNYEFQVLAKCSASDSSAWTGVVTFTTPCNAINLPYTENFDGTSAPALPSCMSATNNNADANTWATSAYSPYVRSLPNAISINYNASAAMNDWFYTPGLNLEAGKTYKVDFYYKATAGSYPEKMEVKFGTSADAASMTSAQIFNNPNINNVLFTLGTGTFTVPSNGVYYVGFHGYSNANMDRICVDDIAITEVVPSSETDIVTFNLTTPAATGTVDAVNHTVALTVPFGTNVTALVPTFTLSTGATAKVAAVNQVSGTTTNNFTSPVTYTVTAENGTTTQDWTVTVNVTPGSAETDILTFNLTTPAATGTVDAVNHTVTLTVPYGTNVTALVPTFTVSANATISVASVNQVSGTTANNFTTPVTYTVTAQNGTTTQNWIVTVNVTPPSTATDFITFNLTSPIATGTVDAVNHTVALFVPNGTNLTALAPTFTVSTGAIVKVAAVNQVSGTTANNFTTPVTYTVTAQDGTTSQDWVVTVTETALSPETDILTFNLASPLATGIIDAVNHTVTLTVPFGTNVTALVPTFTLSAGATVKVGAVNQVSGTTSNNFTTPVTYTVTAENGTTTQNWTVIVNVTPGSAETEILTFNLSTPTAIGTVNATAHTVALTVPFGTNVTALVPIFTLSTGATAKVASINQVSGTTANNFTTPVTYTVTAQNGTTTQDWTVTVTVASATTFTVTYNVVGSNGTLDATVNSAAITSPATVAAGSAVVFTASPAANYSVKEWKVDGTVVAGNVTNNYTLGNVAANTTVTVEFQFNTAINETGEAQVSIYPNPANDLVNVKMSTTIHKITVLNMNGQTIAETAINNYQGVVNTSSLPNGMYFLRIETANGVTMNKIQILK